MTEKCIFIRLGALLLAALLIGLSGCGDLSLYSALEGDGGGEFHLSPQTAWVQEDTAFTFKALGGFTPYNIAVTGGVTAKDDHTWEFPPTTISGNTEDFVIEATDLLGNTATATVTVFDPSIKPVLNPTALTLTVGESKPFTVTSGGTPPYTWTLNEVVQEGETSNTYTPTFNTAGSFTVGVTDSLGFYCEAAVTVLSLELAISPTADWVLKGDTLLFKAFGGDGSYDFSADGGTISDANPATYTAPETEGTYTITLRDGADPPQVVTASVVVTDVPPAPLVLSPSTPKVTRVGDTVQFKAFGGIEPSESKPWIAPYVFSSSKPEAGFIDANTGLYTQLLAKKNVIVTVTDAGGNTTHTRVKWQ